MTNEERLARLEALADELAGTVAKATSRSRATYSNPMAERIAREGRGKPIRKLGPLAAALIPLAGAAIGAVGSAVGGLLSAPPQQSSTESIQLTDTSYAEEKSREKSRASYSNPMTRRISAQKALDGDSMSQLSVFGELLEQIGHALSTSDEAALQAALDRTREVCPFEDDGEPIRKIANTPLHERSPLAEYAKRQMQRPRGQPVPGTFTKDATPDAFLERLREVIQGAQTGEVENPWRELGFHGRTWPRRQG